MMRETNYLFNKVATCYNIKWLNRFVAKTN